MKPLPPGLPESRERLLAASTLSPGSWAARAGGEKVIAAVSWSACSCGMTLLNKVAVSRTDAPLLVIVAQMVVTTALALCSCNLRFGDGTLVWALTVPPLFCLMMATSMVALQHVSVGTFVVVRNLGPLVTLGVETLVHRPDDLHFDGLTVASTSAIALGVLVYETQQGLSSSSALGTACLLLNLFAACAERMLQRHLLAIRKVRSCGCSLAH